VLGGNQSEDLTRICAATILSLTLVVSVSAGDIHSPRKASTEPDTTSAASRYNGRLQSRAANNADRSNGAARTDVVWLNPLVTHMDTQTERAAINDCP